MNYEEQETVTGTNQYVIFKLGEESYGVSIHYVEIIEKVTEITRVPNTADYVKGVINLRGEIVPVIDLRMILGLETVEETEDSRIIILNVEELKVGMMTDSSSEVLTIPWEQIENAVGAMSDVEESLIKGIGKVGNRMIILLDIHAIFGLEEQETAERSLKP